MEGVTVDLVDTVLEECYFKKESGCEYSANFYIVKLIALNPNCEGNIHIISFSWIHFTKTKTMNNVLCKNMVFS